MAGRRMLVLLDNARDAEQVRALLPGTPTSLVVVTSRNLLTPLVAGSGAHPVVLDLLSADEARQLLANRLGTERVETEPDAVEKIIEICARLPLALTIAAARVQQSRFVLSAIAEELCDVDQRLDALDAGDPTSQVRAALSWSYEALTPGARHMFRLLGLNPGPDISLAAVASLAGQSRSVVRALLAELARSNLAVEHVPGRYTLHDLLRAYAAELAHAVDGVDQRHAATTRLLDHYVHTAFAADRLLREQRDPVAVPLAPLEPGVCLVQLTDRTAATSFMASEHRNLLAGVRYATDAGFHAHALQGAWAMDTFHRSNGYWQEAIDAGHCALAAAKCLGDVVARAQAHRGIAPAFTMSGRHGESETHLRQALDLYIEAGDRAEQARTHGYLLSLLLRQGDVRQALDHARQQLLLSEGSGDTRALAHAANDVGWCHALLGQHEEAMRHCRRAIDLIRGVGDTYGEANIWDSLGYVHQQRAEYREAVTCYQHALALLRDRGSRSCLSETLERLGDTHDAAGDADAARDAWREALNLFVDLGRFQTADAVRSKLDTAGLSS
jgi:tetratricopeptide (TPR) repeat protein